MKNIKIVISLFMILLLCGCMNKKDESSKNVNIYTTVYPITYITSKLYGENNVVKSIYPNGVDLNDYKINLKNELIID